MNFIGRITKDAVVNQLKDERQVVNFTIALNDFYKPKDSDQGVKVTTYVNCSYWISTKIAEQLKKGALAEVSGRIDVAAYIGLDGEAKASLNCHANTIKVHQSGKHKPTVEESPKKSVKGSTKGKEKIDDLPF
jgi:single-strand DNA-binding protein